MRNAAFVLVTAALAAPLARGATCTPDLHDVRLVSRTATWSGKSIQLSESHDAGMAILTGCTFTTGTIELDIRGRDVMQKSFVGVAFHATEDGAYEAVYFRPFNFASTDADRHAHAVQYIAEPQFGWKKLRAEHPGVYEHAIVPAVAAAEWFHARIEVTDARVTVFVDGSREPALSVERLSKGNDGAVGLWAGSDSDGEFARVRITSR